MRNLDECRAEVFRRSEKRMEERRQRRKRIVMTGIPLVLCITVAGVIGLPDTGSTGSPLPEGAEELIGVVAPDGSDGSVAGSVEVYGDGLSHLYTAEEDVRQIMRLLERIVAVPETSGGGEDKNHAVNGDLSTESEEYTGMGYKIVVRRSDGSSAGYLLEGSLLTDLAKQAQFPMSEELCLELRDALGIDAWTDERS